MKRIESMCILLALLLVSCENKYPTIVYIYLDGENYVEDWDKAYFYGIYSSKAGVYDIEGSTPKHYTTSIEDEDDIFQISVYKEYTFHMYDYYTYLIVEIHIEEKGGEKELIFKDSTNKYNDGFIITYP